MGLFKRENSEGSRGNILWNIPSMKIEQDIEGKNLQFCRELSDKSMRLICGFFRNSLTFLRVFASLLLECLLENVFLFQIPGLVFGFFDFEGFLRMLVWIM